MGVVEEMIRKEDDGSLSFGNYLLDSKTKKSDFEYQGDMYKVKTFRVSGCTHRICFYCFGFYYMLRVQN